MKQPYVSPQIAVERFSLTQHVASCSAIKINSTDAICVMQDPDSTPGMLDLAFQNGFLDSTVCLVSATDGDALCYHTSSAMAFTS